MYAIPLEGDAVGVLRNLSYEEATTTTTLTTSTGGGGSGGGGAGKVGAAHRSPKSSHAQQRHQKHQQSVYLGFEQDYVCLFVTMFGEGVSVKI